MGNNKKTSADSALTLKITVITVIAIVWIICLAFIITKCENKPEESSNPHPDTVTEETEKITNPYDSVESGKVKKEDSKTLAYFNSRFKESYYTVIEAYTETVNEGYNFMTIQRAYSTDGYLYERSVPVPYYDSKTSDMGITRIVTPEGSYTLYEDQRTYFKAEQTTENYKNTFNFPGEEFKTGTINVNGVEFYYEELPVQDGVTTKYCFGKEDNLKYRISTSQKGSATETYYEYSNEVDPSLFEIPEDYTLQE